MNCSQCQVHVWFSLCGLSIGVGHNRKLYGFIYILSYYIMKYYILIVEGYTDQLHVKVWKETNSVSHEG